MKAGLHPMARADGPEYIRAHMQLRTHQPHSRWTHLAAVALTMVGLGLPLSIFAADLPPLNAPASEDHHPGKIVWAELFTSDSAAASKFYSGVFGWTAETLTQKGVSYTVFRNGRHVVAGLRQRSGSAAAHASRWIDYIAVADIATTLALVAPSGGQVRAPAREFPQIGAEAIITDNAGYPVGLVQSASGDSADEEPAPGDWNWFHLLATTPTTSIDFYRHVFGFEVAPDSRPGRQNSWFLATGLFNRAGVSAITDQSSAAPGWLGIIRVQNLDQTLARVPELGGEVVVPPHPAALGSRSAIITDPTGGAVGVVEYVNQANPVNPS